MSAYPGVLTGSYTYDFHNPFMSGTIVTKTGRYALWTQGQNNQAFNIDTLDPNLGNLKALSFLSELVVENNLGWLPIITATLTPPLIDAIRFTETELVEYGATALEVVFGYATGASANGQPGAVLTNPLSGVTAIPDVTLGTDSTIVLKAHGVGAYGAYFTQSGQVYPPSMTTMDIINQICARNYVTPLFTNLSADPTSQSTLNAPPISGGYSQGGRTDWTVIQDLCSLSRCFAVISSTTNATGQPPQGNLVIQPRAVFASAAATLTLAFFSFPTGPVVGSSVFPILSLSTPTTAIWAPGVRAAIMKDVDTMTKKSRSMGITNSTQTGLLNLVNTKSGTAQLNPGAGDIMNDPNMAALNSSLGIGLLPLPGATDNPTAIQQGMSAFDTAKWAMGVHLDIETMGCPTIFPGMVVNVAGCGLRLNGNYGVITVTHTLGSNGYTTHLHLIQNTAAMLAQVLAAQNAGPIGTGTAGTADNSNSTAVQPTPQQ
jgi:hypothetical protein